MASPRVLQVEDDPALRRFVALALDELDIELVQCATVAAAVEVLQQAPVRLILTDLMMPGESGFDLLQRLQDAPALRGSALVVVLSAGLTAQARAQLSGLGVWRMLGKPASVSALEACVREALADAAGDAVPAPPPPPANADLAGAEAAAIRDYFEGDQALFDAYRSACVEQFPVDIQEGDVACAGADLPSLRRVAHSLKSVLLTLGHPGLSALARELEDSSHAGMLATARTQWEALRSQLRVLLPGA